MKFNYFDWQYLGGVFHDNLENDPAISSAVKKILSITNAKKIGIDVGGSLRNRASTINNLPLSMMQSQYPVPVLPSKPLVFSEVMDTVLQKLQQLGTNKTIYVAWSGGIDSTSIVAGILRNFNTLSNIVILYSDISIYENPRFFEKFIKPNFTTIYMDDFQLSADMLDHCLIVDGNCGNQIFGNKWISKAVQNRDTRILNLQWREIDFSKLVGTQKGLELVDYIKSTVDDSPVPINTVYDFAWWGWFNLKFESVIYRPTLMYYNNSTGLNNRDLQRLCTEVFYRPYAAELMQQWSMISLDERREKEKLTVKWHAKDYIRSVDGDPYYFLNKTVTESNNRFLGGNPCFAIDQDWNCLKLSDPATRKKIVELLRAT